MFTINLIFYIDGPADEASPTLPNSVSVHTDDPHCCFYCRRPRDSRGAAAALKQTTPHSTLGRTRIRSARFSVPTGAIGVHLYSISANSHGSLYIKVFSENQ